MKEFNLSENRKKLFDQLWRDLQEGNLTLRDIFNDCVEVHKELDKEFIRKLKEEINNIFKENINVAKETDVPKPLKRAILDLCKNLELLMIMEINHLAGDELK